QAPARNRCAGLAGDRGRRVGDVPLAGRVPDLVGTPPAHLHRRAGGAGRGLGGRRPFRAAARPRTQAPLERGGVGRVSADIPVGTREIARLAAVAPDTVDEWRRRHAGFPSPAWTVSGRPAWRLGDVVDWLRATGRWPTRVVAAAIDLAELDGRP